MGKQMKIGTMLNGDRFITKLTRRSGVVIDCTRQDTSDGVKIRFEDGEEKNIHTNVDVTWVG